MTAEQSVELGRTGIVLAPLGVGAMSWGTKRALAYGGADSAEAEQEALGALLEGGVTLVDTAEMYRNETRIGELVRGHNEVVLATKYAPFIWRRRASVLAALDRSLKRLEVGHVDLYQVHMQPRTMSMRTLMNELVKAYRDGRILAIGVSNFDERRLREAHAILASEGIALASNQVQYSLLHREPESNGVLDACRELGVTLIAYMPLASGALTGKYHAGNKPSGIRRVLPSFRGSNFDALPPVIELLTEIGNKHEATPSQVALRWVIQHGAVPIPGAKNAVQARSNAGALNIVLDQSEMDALDEATKTWLH